MRNVSVLTKILLPVVGVAAVLTIRHLAYIGGPGTLITSVGAAQAKPQISSIPSCSGDSSGPPAGQASPQGGPKPHSVTLSWNPSVPASNSPKDVIKGYFVFRSQTSQTYADSNRLNSLLLIGTQCLDTTVEPRATYYYVVKAMSAGGEKSVASKEIKAVIPFP